MKENPWVNITEESKILEIDRAVIEQHNAKYSKNSRKISLIDFPEPFIGDPNAQIYILLANPGRAENESNLLEFLEKNQLVDIILKNLKHEVGELDFPFYFLDPKFQKHPGYSWWNKVFENIIKGDVIIRKKLAQVIFEVELYGYHSSKCEKSLINKKSKLASSDYSFHLVNKAIDENKIILLPRAVGDWFNKVPRLKTYDNCHFVASNRGIQFSRKTISPKAYLEIDEIIRGAK